MKKSKLPSFLISKIQNLISEYLKNFNYEEETSLRQSLFWMRCLTWALISTSTFTFALLLIARTDEVVVANGKLEPIGDVKEIQIPVGGITESILIKEGDSVLKGQILIQLDAEVSKEKVDSVLSRIKKKQNELTLKIKEKEITSIISKTSLVTKRKELEIRQSIYEKYKFLYEEGGISEIDYLEALNKLIAIKGSINQEQIELDRKKSIIDQEIEQIKSNISQLQSNHTEAKVAHKYKSIIAPVDGVVFDLKPTTVGYVAQSAEPIMKIVPYDKIEADIEIPSRKIGFVKVGMPVEISIDSFPSTDFGVINGVLSVIGSDALPPSPRENKTELLYPANVKLNSQSLQLKNGQVLPLQVGMSLTANIKLRKVNYIQLLLGKFQSKAKSLNQI